MNHNKTKSLSLNQLVFFPIFLFISCPLVFGSSISGTVSDSLTGLPIENVSVFLEGKNISTQSDSNGIFKFDNLTSGKYIINFEHVAYNALLRNIQLLNNDERNIHVLLIEKILKTSNIYVEKNKWHSPFYDPLKAAQKIESATMINSPGGFEDPFKSLQDLSGIQARHDFTSQFYIHGCGPEHHAVSFDGLILYNPYRIKFLGFGGMSIFNPDVLNSLTITKGGYEAAFGNRMGSHIALHSKEVTGTLKSSASVNLLSSRIILEVPVTNNIATIISGRRTYYDWMIDLFSDDNIIYPYFYDIYNKWSWQIADNHNFNLIQIIGKEGASITSTKYSDFDINFKNEAFNFLTKLELSGSIREPVNYRLIVAYQENKDSSQSNTEESYDHYQIENKQWTWKLDLSFASENDNSITTGLQVTDLKQFGQINLSFFNDRTIIPQKTIYNKNYSWYIQNNLILNPKFNANLGFRLDYNESKDEFLESPRLSFKWNANKNWTLVNQMGVYYQYPKLIDNFYEENIFNISNRISDLPAMKSRYISHIIEGNIFNYFNIKINPYYRSVEDIPVVKNLSNSMYPYVASEGKLKSKGIDLLINYNYKHGFLNIGYAYSKTELRKSEEEEYNPVYFDQRHWINSNMEYNFSKNWALSSAAKYGSGFPFNAISAIIESSSGNWKQIKSNNYSYSKYFRWDIRVAYNLNLFNIYFEIINITDSKNFDSQFYYINEQDDFSTMRIFNVYMMPRLPVFGFSINL